MKAKYPVMFNKLKRDKGMVYVMEAIEAAVQALLAQRIQNQAGWRASKERLVIKERVAWLAAFAGNIPSTKKAWKQYHKEIAQVSEWRTELLKLMFRKFCTDKKKRKA
jgi:hypothetical protein